MARRCPFLAIYSKYGPVTKACERYTFSKLRVCERGSFSVKKVDKPGKELDLGAECPRIKLSTVSPWASS